MNDDEKLIPELKDWRGTNGSDFSIDNWTASEGNISLAIGYSFIFWPDFFEYDDCIFLKSHFSPNNFKEWIQNENIKNYAQIESVINHLHILDLFSTDKWAQISYEQIKFLGDILSDIYITKLTAQFPDRKFIVTFNGDEIFDDLIDYEITFYQLKSENRKTKYGR